MSSKLNIVSFICCIALLSCNTTKSNQPNAKLDSIKNCIQKYVDGYNIPGIAVGIIKDNKVIANLGFGEKVMKSGDSINQQSIFHMASLSKPVTATAIMQLVEQGKINLDSSITEYLPYFKLKDSAYKQIKIKDILTHSSGMPDVNDYEWDKPQFDEGSAERYVRSIANEEMIAQVGERWRYSNMAYDVLADVVAKVSGMSFETYVKEHILVPLRMRNSSFIPNDLNPDLRTKGHVWDFGTSVSDIYPYNRRHAPSSCLNSTLEDMCQWALVNLNNGELNGNNILKESSHDILFTPQFKINENRSIGLSWFVEDYKGMNTVSHEGSDLGYRSKIIFAPEISSAIIIASNYNMTPVNEIAFNIINILQGHEPDPIEIPISFTIGNEIFKIGMEASIAKYYKIKNSQEAKNYDLSESQLNRLGYQLLRAEKYTEAIEIFKLNTKEYPNSANVYDSLAEAYMRNGQNNLAISFYKITLQMNSDNDFAKKALLELKTQN